MEKYVMDEEWDFLIILDACRYDYFKEIYKNYLDGGNSMKAISPAIETIEWCQKKLYEIL